MTTQWRNKDGFKNKKTEEFISTPTQFANIPMFEVLHKSENKNGFVNNANTTSMNNPTILEGFNMFGDEYYKDVPKLQLGIKGISDIGTKIRELISKITDPINKLDQNFEDTFVFLLQSYFMKPCLNVYDISGVISGHTAGANTSFTWLNDAYYRFINGPPSTKEGLTIGDVDHKVDETVRSFALNHTDISEEDIKRLYIDELQKYYYKLNNNVTSNQLFLFNNHFDNTILSNPDIKKIIPTPPPVVNKEPYQVRFDIKDTSNIISYYPFNYGYLTIPKDAMKDGEFDINYFNETVYNNNMNYQNYVDSTTFSKDKFNIGNGIPNEVNLQKLDLNNPKKLSNINYYYSINRTTSQITSNIQTYLDYIIKLFSFIVFYKELHKTTDGFELKPATLKQAYYKEILTRVGTVYINCINTVERAYYKLNYTYLTPDEIAMFNHLFYCCLFEPDKTENNIYTIRDTVMSSLISNLNYHLYYTLTQMYLLDSQKIQPEDVLYYSYNGYTATARDSDTVNEFIMSKKNDANPDVQEFYRFQECDIENANQLKTFRRCAKVLKREIYRILCIPIVIYLVYNFYYLFFFKDCFDETRTDSEYKDNCKNCFHPIFPDWERAFHKMENNNTDYVFEFIFKPTKFLYNMLNSIKAVFRKPGLLGIDILEGKVFKDEYPYVLFLFTFFVIYTIIIKHGKLLLNVILGLFKLEPPNINIPGSSVGTDYLASAIIFISFVKIFYTEKMEISGKWITEGTGGLVTIAKAICSLIYWIGKILITTMIIPISILICTIYMIWIGLFGISNYTDNAHRYADKTEMIDRVLYTSLYSESKTSVNFAFKCIAFTCIYFLTEIIILIIMKRSLTEIGNIKMSPNAKDYENTNLAKFKSFINILYTIIFILLALWCYYKYKIKMPIMNGYYKTTSEPGYINKSLHISCENDGINLAGEFNSSVEHAADKDAIYNSNKTNMFNTFVNADEINNAFLEYYEKKTENIKHRPIVKKMFNALSSFGESVSKKIAKMDDSMDNSIFNTRIINMKKMMVRDNNDSSAFENKDSMTDSIFFNSIKKNINENWNELFTKGQYNIVNDAYKNIKDNISNAGKLLGQTGENLRR